MILCLTEKVESLKGCDGQRWLQTDCSDTQADVKKLLVFSARGSCHALFVEIFFYWLLVAECYKICIQAKGLKSYS